MNQNEVFGTGSIVKLAEVLKINNAKKIFLVTGKKSYDLYIKSHIEPILNNYESVRFSDFSENPKLSEIKKGLIEFSKKKFDIIIAIGGGSAIDVAKSINYFSSQKKNILDILTTSMPAATSAARSGWSRASTNHPGLARPLVPSYKYS